MMKVVNNGILTEFSKPIIYYGCKDMDLGKLRIENADSLIIDGGDSWMKIPLSKRYSKSGNTIELGGVRLYSQDRDTVKRLCTLIGEWVAHHKR